MLFIPAFIRHNLLSKVGDADADEVEFEGCSQRRPTAAPKRLFDDAEPEAAGAVVERQTRQVRPRVQVRTAAQSPVANPRTSTTASRSPMHLRGATSPSPARQQQHGFVTPISSEKRPDASAKETPETPPAKKRRCNNPLGQNQTEEVRRMAARAHSNFLIRGKTAPKPIDTMAELGHAVGKNFCRDMYKEIFEGKGTFANKSGEDHGGVTIYGEEVDKLHQGLIRKHRPNWEVLSFRDTAKELRALIPEGSPAPAHSTVWRHEQQMGYKTHNITPRPILGELGKQKREEFAQEHAGEDLTRTLVLDEKIFTETKPQIKKKFKARDCSPVPDDQMYLMFKGSNTNTQLTKLMYLAVSTEGKKVGLYEINCADPRNTQKNGDQGKGLCASLFQCILDEVEADALKQLGPGK
jgi:hypothetical protein